MALYGCKIWILNKAEAKILKGFVMWCWKMLPSWTERRTNENVLGETNEYRLMFKTIKVRRWNVAGYVLDRENELLYKKNRRENRRTEDDQNESNNF